ncbi:hypothetical protein N752_05380 [Desulforamulus aquiferis]|nr:hypothetical protein [Desulforamulus aquiferis]RYD06326.1 hypothetical protein N752_05380 [Desulforamulus aquiferis]
MKPQTIWLLQGQREGNIELRLASGQRVKEQQNAEYIAQRLAVFFERSVHLKDDAGD